MSMPSRVTCERLYINVFFSRDLGPVTPNSQRLSKGIAAEQGTAILRIDDAISRSSPILANASDPQAPSQQSRSTTTTQRGGIRQKGRPNINRPSTYTSSQHQFRLSCYGPVTWCSRLLLLLLLFSHELIEIRGQSLTMHQCCCTLSNLTS